MEWGLESHFRANVAGYSEIKEALQKTRRKEAKIRWTNEEHCL